MKPSLHVWIGNPRTEREFFSLRDSLIKLIPSTAEAPVVVENRVLAISDLAHGFTRSVRTKKQIEERAKEFGIESATLMIGLEASLQSPEKLCPKGLTYLGLFQADEEHDYVDEDPSKRGSLYWAIIEGDLAVAKLILKSNPASVYEKNHVGHTPLMASATTERPDITDLLLESGARVDEVTPDNSFNALHWALHHHPKINERFCGLSSYWSPTVLM